MSENSSRSPNRRTFVKTIGGIGFSAAILSGTTNANPGDKSKKQVEEGDSLEERIRKSDPQKLREYYTERYSLEVAREVQKIWTTYTQAVLDGTLNEETATQKAINELKKVAPALREDIEAAHQEAADIGSNAAATAQPTREFSPEGGTPERITTEDQGYTGEILRIDGQKGGSGIGYRDCHYYVWKDTITSIVETAIIGSLTQWVDFRGNFLIDEGNGGSYSVTAEYWHNGMLLGGESSYDLWIKPRDSPESKTFFNFRSPGSSVYGNDSRTVQLTLSGDTIYDFGFRLTTSINGIADALVDYQTVNADGSTRKLRLDSLWLQPI